MYTSYPFTCPPRPRRPHPRKFLSATRLHVHRSIDPGLFYQNLSQIGPISESPESSDRGSFSSDTTTTTSTSKSSFSNAPEMRPGYIILLTFELSNDRGVRLKDILGDRREHIKRAMENHDEHILKSVKEETLVVSVRWPGYILHKMRLILNIHPSRWTRFDLAAEIAKEMVDFVTRRRIMISLDHRWRFGDPYKGEFCFDDLILVSIFQDTLDPESKSNEWEVELAIDKYAYRDMATHFAQ
ncbi:hypothetical protein DL96DRAFT_1581736 [Flagelloscypha sp. PMI_526]|nr:hypothetical protein DL96DRAFT_1581736 [Flagelloscypha sp. PMI_526]